MACDHLATFESAVGPGSCPEIMRRCDSNCGHIVFPSLPKKTSMKEMCEVAGAEINAASLGPVTAEEFWRTELPGDPGNLWLQFEMYWWAMARRQRREAEGG